MRLLTHSRLATFRACPRKHLYAYTLRYRAVRRAPALAFGDAVHQALAAYWLARQAGAAGPACLTAALRAIPRDEVLDEFDDARARAMVAGYAASWGGDDVVVLAVEREFVDALQDPATGLASEAWLLGGKLDLVLRDRTGAVLVVEHKTTSESAAPGAAYRTRLAVDGQVRQYVRGARSLGFDAAVVLYDVLVKPRLRPRGEEPPGAYFARVLADMMAEPSRYFQRVAVARDPAIEARYLQDVWHLGEAIAQSERGWAVHNPDACFRFGTPCEFWGVCSGTADLQDARYFRRAEREHEELGPAAQRGAET